MKASPAALVKSSPAGSGHAAGFRWQDSTLYIALALAGFTVAFGTAASRHQRAP